MPFRFDAFTPIMHERQKTDPLQVHCNTNARPRGYKTFFMLTQLSMKFFLHINVKMPTIVGILTFISGKNSIIGLSEPKQAESIDIYIVMSI